MSQRPTELPDVQGEPTYTFVFHVFPPDLVRPDPNPIMKMYAEEIEYDAIYEFTEDRLFARVWGPEAEDWRTLKNQVRVGGNLFADAVGFAAACAITLIPERYTGPDGVEYLIDTAFEGLYDHFGGFDAALFAAILAAAGSGEPQVGRALSEIRLAILEPEMTAVHAFRAVESIRHLYLEGRDDDGQERRRSWERLRTAITVPKDILDWLTDLATPARHGNPVSLSGDDRRRAISVARGVVRDHVGA